jgi:two-component system sensor histidine kinase/response regulator
MTVIGKITISFVVFASVSLLSMIMSFDGLNDIKRAISRVSVVEEPISAAIYEMQIKISGSSVAVLKYLETGEAKYRKQFAVDKSDFEILNGKYERLVTKEEERQSGGDIGELYREYHRIGQSLMDQKEEQEDLAGKIIKSIEALDAMLDDRVPSGQSPVGSDGVKKTAIASELGGSNAAVGTWLGHFLRTSKKEYKDRIFDNAKEFRRHLDTLKMFKLEYRERFWVRDLEVRFNRTMSLVQTVLATHDSLQRDQDQFLNARAKMEVLVNDDLQLSAAQNLDQSKKQADAASTYVIWIYSLLIPSFIIISIGAALLIIRSIRRPLDQLMKGTDAVSNGDLTYRLTIGGRNEFAELAQNFNQMVARLQATTVSKKVLELSEARLREVNGELVREATERKRALAQFQLLVESAPNGFLMVDSRGTIVLANTQIEKIFGYSKRELLGRSIDVLLPERFRGPLPGRWANFLVAPESRTMGVGGEIVAMRKDGGEFPVEVGLNPIETSEGSHVLACVIDISERKAAENRQHQTEERFRATIENVQDHAIFMLDPAGLVLTWNKGAERVRGYSAEEIIGAPHSIFFSAEDQKSGKPQQLLNTAITDGQCEDEGWRLRKDGSKYWASTVLTPVYDRVRQLTGFATVTRDLTRRIQIEDELTQAKDAAEAANEAKSDFLANISHEIRTPMTGVIGMSGLLCETELTDKQREYCEIIRRSGESLLTIINEVLDFSKIESGKLEMEIIDFDLRSAVQEAVELFVRQADDKGVELINFIRPDVPTNVRGDPGRLRQILSNLVGNALKFTTEGEVVVGVDVVEQIENTIHLRFEVNDTGIGIAKDKIDKLFNAFTQADSSITRNYGGTGLGLAICKKFVELMGGQIGVSSEEGWGSSFWFTLNLEISHLSEPRPTHADLSGLRMLIIDDNSTHRVLLESYLSSLGICSQSASDASSALNLLQAAAKSSELPDLVLLDSSLPDMDALELARAIRRENGSSQLKFLLMNTVGKRVDLGLHQSAGIDGILTKPISLSHLVESMTVALGRTARTDDSIVETSRHTQPELGAQRPLRILVADDNHINQKVAASLLENFGHRADVVANGHEAIEAYRLVPYDIVLMDVQMPELDGFEASRRIRALEKKKNRHTPIIAMTAHAREEDKEKCLAAGMDDYVSKPIRPQELKAAIARRLAATMVIQQPIEPPTEAPAHADVLNFSQALELVDGNRELLCEVARIFLNQYPKVIEETRRALSQQDYDTLTSAVHSLVASVGQIGGQRACAAARKLELISREGDRSQVPAALAELEREIMWLRSAMSDPAYFRLQPNESLH